MMGKDIREMKILMIFLLVSGWFIAVSGNLLLGHPKALITLFLGLIITLGGCYIWVRRKSRHPAFILFGILSPVGLLGIPYLKISLNQRK